LISRSKADVSHLKTDVRFYSDTAEKVFFGDEQIFLEPLMHFTRGDVRDHIDSSKSTTDLRH